MLHLYITLSLIQYPCAPVFHEAYCQSIKCVEDTVALYLDSFKSLKVFHIRGSLHVHHFIINNITVTAMLIGFDEFANS